MQFFINFITECDEVIKAIGSFIQKINFTVILLLDLDSQISVVSTFENKIN